MWLSVRLHNFLIGALHPLKFEFKTKFEVVYLWWIKHLVSISQKSQVCHRAREIPKESDQFRFLCVAWLANLKGPVGLILAWSSVMRVSIPLDLSTRSYIPLFRFLRSHHRSPLLAPSLGTFSSALCLSGTWCASICEVHRLSPARLRVSKFICSRLKKRRKPRVKLVTLKLCWVWNSR